MFIRHSAVWMSRLSHAPPARRRRRSGARRACRSRVQRAGSRHARRVPSRDAERDQHVVHVDVVLDHGPVAQLGQGRGRSVTRSGPRMPVLRMMKFSRLVSTTKWRSSSAPASGETKRRRNQTHSRVHRGVCGEPTRKQRLATRISATDDPSDMTRATDRASAATTAAGRGRPCRSVARSNGTVGIAEDGLPHRWPRGRLGQSSMASSCSA